MSTKIEHLLSILKSMFSYAILN